MRSFTRGRGSTPTRTRRNSRCCLLLTVQRRFSRPEDWKCTSLGVEPNKVYRSLMEPITIVVGGVKLTAAALYLARQAVALRSEYAHKEVAALSKNIAKAAARAQAGLEYNAEVFDGPRSIRVVPLYAETDRVDVGAKTIQADLGVCCVAPFIVRCVSLAVRYELENRTGDTITISLEDKEIGGGDMFSVTLRDKAISWGATLLELPVGLRVSTFADLEWRVVLVGPWPKEKQESSGKCRVWLPVVGVPARAEQAV